MHGGAIDAGVEPAFSQIEVERFDVKDRIGAAAAALVEDGQTVMIDIGTSTLQLARHLHGREITVVTTNLAVVEELLPDPDIELVLPGGIVRRNYRSLVGVLAEDSLRQLKSDIALPGHERRSTSSSACGTRRWSRSRSSALMIAGADAVVADRRRREVLDDRRRARVRRRSRSTTSSPTRRCRPRAARPSTPPGSR